MDIAIIILSIICGLVIYRIASKERGKKAIQSNEIAKEYFASKSGYLYKFIINEIEKIDKRVIGSTVSMSFYDTFKENISDFIYHKINKKKEEDIHYFGTPDGIELDGACLSNIISMASSDIMHSTYIDNLLATIFTSAIAENAEEAHRIEQEAIDYNNTFGKEPDGYPELHPRDTISDAYGDDDPVEKSFEDLLSIGTAEDIED